MQKPNPHHPVWLALCTRSLRLKLCQVRLLARAEKADAVEDQAGLLPVHVAASAGQANMVVYLAARAGVEVANRQGLSPLMCAANRWLA